MLSILIPTPPPVLKILNCSPSLDLRRCDSRLVGYMGDVGVGTAVECIEARSTECVGSAVGAECHRPFYPNKLL